MISLIWMRKNKLAFAVHDFQSAAQAEARARSDFERMREALRIDRVEVRDRDDNLCFYLQATKGPSDWSQSKSTLTVEMMED